MALTYSVCVPFASPHAAGATAGRASRLSCTSGGGGGPAGPRAAAGVAPAVALPLQIEAPPAAGMMEQCTAQLIACGAAAASASLLWWCLGASPIRKMAWSRRPKTVRRSDGGACCRASSAAPAAAASASILAPSTRPGRS